MKHLIKLLVMALLLLNICCCDWDEWIKKSFENNKKAPKENIELNKMPSKTEIGANTFGCYINGKLVAAKGFYQEEGIDSYWNTRYVNAFRNRMSIKGGVYTEMKFEFTAKCYYLSMSLNDEQLSLGKNKCYFYMRCNSLESSIKADIIKDLSIEITKIDRGEHIICGHFDDIEMQIADSLFRISKGRFDVKYGQNFY